ncbi:hypothetical protein Rumeso_03377 [Rubellimicrobium mesophilum DSM 19309]|uniref:Uncharacterized protein n=1 Tax=Rubellimicrobium mesophilum DSM 19309 TaxID=442562 RepID=A0A017HMS3_9RHOB|nr:hypothetical protein Rumeso_03377 [Rubellimicrobium mesophilum DSM 19309]
MAAPIHPIGALLQPGAPRLGPGLAAMRALRPSPGAPPDRSTVSGPLTRPRGSGTRRDLDQERP